MVSWSLLIGLLAAFWVYNDAKNRGQNKNSALLWAIGTFAMLIVFLPLYLLIGRRKADVRRNDEKTIDVEATIVEETISCPMCANKVKEEYKVCPYCGYTLRPKCEQCGQELKREWKLCPNCQTPSSDK